MCPIKEVGGNVVPPSNTFSKRVAMRVIWLLTVVGLLSVHTLYGQDQRFTLSGFVTDEVVESVRRVLHDEQFRRQMVDHNYQIAKQFFSYDRVETELRAILSEPPHSTVD